MKRKTKISRKWKYRLIGGVIGVLFLIILWIAIYINIISRDTFDIILFYNIVVLGITSGLQTAFNLSNDETIYLAKFVGFFFYMIIGAFIGNELERWKKK